MIGVNSSSSLPITSDAAGRNGVLNHQDGVLREPRPKYELQRQISDR